MAYFLIPMDINFQLFNGYLIIDNWRVFLITCSVMVFLAAFLVYTMDESPKFLMAVGRHKEALNVFRKIYSQNTGNPPESYPVSINTLYIKILINKFKFYQTIRLAF